VAQFVPLDRILIETDSPSPVPRNGKNQQRRMPFVAQIATLKELSVESVARQRARTSMRCSLRSAAQNQESSETLEKSLEQNALAVVAGFSVLTLVAHAGV
jgi:hypothetical protein